MKKVLLLTLPLALICTSCSLFGGTSESFTIGAGETGIYIGDDGKVLYSFAEDFGKDYYNKDDLKKIIEDEISSFNSKNSKDAELDEFDVDDNVAKAKIEFDSTDDFITYRKQFEGASETDMFIGSIKSALANGFDISGEFIKVDDGKVTKDVEISSIITGLDEEIVIVHNRVKLEIKDAKIEYVSSNCKINDGVVTVVEQNSEYEVAYVVYSK